MPTCIHRIYSDPDRDTYTYGVSCGKDAIAFSIHPVTGEKLFWCIRHAGEHSDAQPIEVQPIDQEKASLEAALRIAEEAFESAIDMDAPDETIRRLERVRDDAAHRLQMVGRSIR